MFSCDHKKTSNQNANQVPEPNSDIMDWEFLNIKFTKQTKGSDFKKKSSDIQEQIHCIKRYTERIKINSRDENTVREIHNALDGLPWHLYVAEETSNEHEGEYISIYFSHWNMEENMKNKSIMYMIFAIILIANIIGIITIANIELREN